MRKFVLSLSVIMFCAFAFDVHAQCFGGRCGLSRRANSYTQPHPFQGIQSIEAVFASQETPTVTDPLPETSEVIIENQSEALPEIPAESIVEPAPVPEPAPEPVPELAPEPIPEPVPELAPELAPEPATPALQGGGSACATCQNANCPYRQGLNGTYTRSFAGATRTVSQNVEEADGVTTTTQTVTHNGPFREFERTTTVIEGQGTEFEARVLAVLNDYRARAGLAPLTWDESIAQGARGHSSLINSGGWGHAPGHTECIARGNMTPEGVAHMWLNSAPHRAIIMSRASRVGIGCVGIGHTLRVR